MSNALNAAAGDLSEAEIEAAIEAYDAERCRLNEQWHGGKCEPMSAAAKANFRPIHRAALLAASKVRENSRREVSEADISSLVHDIAVSVLDAAGCEVTRTELKENILPHAMWATSAQLAALRSAPAEQDGGSSRVVGYVNLYGGYTGSETVIQVGDLDLYSTEDEAREINTSFSDNYLGAAEVKLLPAPPRSLASGSDGGMS